MLQPTNHRTEEFIMAPKKGKKTEAAETTTEETAEEAASRSQMEKHEAFVEWYDSTYGGSLADLSPAEVIAAFAAKRNEFRRSEGYLSQWGPEAREARKAERAAEREAKAAERAAAKAEKEKAKAEKAKAAEKATKKAPAKGKGSSKGSSKSSAKGKGKDEVFED